MSLRSNLSQVLLNPGCCGFASCPGLCVLPSRSCWQTARCYRPSRQGHSQIRTRHAGLTAAEMLTDIISDRTIFSRQARLREVPGAGPNQAEADYPERSAATGWRRLRRSRAPGAMPAESRPAKQFGCTSVVPGVARNNATVLRNLFRFNDGGALPDTRSVKRLLNNNPPTCEPLRMCHPLWQGSTIAVTPPSARRRPCSDRTEQ